MKDQERKEKDNKNAVQNLSNMLSQFGEAVSEIFDDPKLKRKAKEFGRSAADSVKELGNRFKDEKVKGKFKNVGESAKRLGDNISDIFKK